MAGFVESRNGRHRARFTPPGGKEINETFDRKGDANDWLDYQRGDAVRGQWIDPRGGKTLFGPYARRWFDNRIHLRESTRIREEANLRNHILPTFEDLQFRGIPRGLVQSWVTSLSRSGLAPSTVIGIFNLLKAIVRSAIEDDRLISSADSPCKKINLPEVPDDEVTVPTRGQLVIVRNRLPARYRRSVDAVAGTGVRQGELFGLTEDRIDFLRGGVKVDRQLQPRPELQAYLDEHGRLPKGVKAVPVARGLFLVPPKSKLSTRWIPLGRFALKALAEQIREFPPQSCDASGLGLVFTTTTGQPLRRSTLDDAWEKATRQRSAKDPDRPDPFEDRGRRDPVLEPYFTIHDGRHFYASLLIEKGCSVPRVAKCLGHTQEETLRTYSHLWPDGDDQAREAVDDELWDDDDIGDDLGDTASVRPGLSLLA